jgi:hypothetical protein
MWAPVTERRFLIGKLGPLVFAELTLPLQHRHGELYLEVSLPESVP